MSHSTVTQGASARERSSARDRAAGRERSSARGRSAGRERSSARDGPTATEYVRRDEGFFPPDSVARRVWSYPTSALLGFIRAVTIEHLDPDLAAAVDTSGQVLQRPALRYDRTVQYFATVLYGDAETVVRSSDVLMRIHSRARGENPITGGSFDSNAPSSQLWIHMTAWHSILYVYERFGPGRLSVADEDRYWRECAIAAEFQPIEPASVPRSRDEVRAYLDGWRPHLAASEAAQYNVDFILDGMRTIFTRLPAPVRAVSGPAIRAGVIATYPRWMRPLLGVRQSRLTDSLVTTLLRPAMSFLSRRPAQQVRFLHAVSPHGGPVLSPILRGEAALSPRVWTPPEARAAFGDPRTPLEQYADMLRERSAAGENVDPAGGSASAGGKTSGAADHAGAHSRSASGRAPEAPYEHNHHDPVLEFAEPMARE